MSLTNFKVSNATVERGFRLWAIIGAAVMIPIGALLIQGATRPIYLLAGWILLILNTGALCFLAFVDHSRHSAFRASLSHPLRYKLPHE